MTTPERLRRRQIREGWAILCVGLVMVAQGGYGIWIDRQQNECMAESFRALTVALDARADLANRDERIDAREFMANRDLISAAVSGEVETPKEFKPISKKYLARMGGIKSDRDALEQERETTSIPSFPEGKCE